MTWYDYLIFIVPLIGVMALGFHSRKYIRGVVDFLSAGRLCGRYLLTVGDIANGISIIGILSFVEQKYSVGFAVGFWNQLLVPVTLTMALTGYCIYRFRETKAQSVGEFLEIRYGSKLFRFYFSFVRVLAEMLAHSIMPAVAARFFIYFLGLPESFHFLGVDWSTFAVMMVVTMSLAISLICCGGTLTIVLTDTIQGMICVPLMVLLGAFLLLKFNFGSQILPVLCDRVAGESFIKSFDIAQVRDFNLFALFVSLVINILHRATWLGGGASGSAKTPHEQKMANLLGNWRGIMGSLLYVLIALCVLVTLNHEDFAPQAREIRTEIASRVANDIVEEPAIRAEMVSAFESIPQHTHIADGSALLSKKENLETPYYEAAERVLSRSAEGKGMIQQFQSLYRQQMMSVAMRYILRSGMLGLFALLMTLAMVSTDDSYIFSSSQTIAQDLVLSFFKKAPSPRLHIWIIRLSTIGVGIFFLLCCLGFAQMDYIEMFRMTVLPIYIGGCGPVLVFGLYSRFGTKQGAWTSMLAGLAFSLLFIFCQRGWASLIYPFLENHGWTQAVGSILATLSKPLNPFIVWEMNPTKFPINAYEALAFNMFATFILYIVVSKCTCKVPFNLDKMLHRGIYNIDGTAKTKIQWSFRHILTLLAGITPMHTRADRIISWTLLGYTYLYLFLGTFLGVAIWNFWYPWPLSWWGIYFLVFTIVMPMIFSVVTAVWFWIGGLIDLRNLFHDLKNRSADVLDNGMVQDGVSAADAQRFEEIERAEETEDAEKKNPPPEK